MASGRYSYEGELAYYRSPRRVRSARVDVGPYLRTFPGNPEAFFGGRRILDIGAGGCLYTSYIRERLQPRLIVGLDLMVHDGAGLRLPDGTRLPFVLGDAFRLPFDAASFDIVLSSLVLHQLPNLSPVLSEIRRVLAPDGRFIGWEPNPFHAVVLYRYLFRPHSPNQYLFWPWRYQGAFRDAGFDLSVRYYYGPRPKIRGRLLGTSVGLLARLRHESTQDGMTRFERMAR